METIAAIKEKLQIVSESIYFDETDFLRKKTTDRDQLYHLILEAKKVLEEYTKKDKSYSEEKYLLYGIVGNIYRIYGQPKIAIKYLEMASQISNELTNNTKQVISLIRLGEAYK